MAISIVIADDQRLFRQSLRYFLEKESGLTILGEAQDGQDAVMLCKMTRPDIALMDVHMPRLDGITATKMIQDICPATKVLILSIEVSDQHVSLALESGAVGYILKDASCEEFLRIIKAVHSSEVPVSPYLADISQNCIKLPVSQAEIFEELGITDREKEILQLLVDGHGNTAMANKLWLSEETVKMHLKNIFRKLSVKNRTEAAVFAARQGLC